MSGRSAERDNLPAHGIIRLASYLKTIEFCEIFILQLLLSSRIGAERVRWDGKKPPLLNTNPNGLYLIRMRIWQEVADENGDRRLAMISLDSILHGGHYGGPHQSHSSVQEHGGGLG